VNKEFPELQKLLQLRGQVAPKDEYFEDFLQEFHRRQRQDLMRRSARSLFLERLSVWFREMGSARWALGAAVGYAALMVLLFAWPKGAPGNEGLAPASRQMEIPEEERVNIPPFDPAQPEVANPGAAREF
jgi:hypothetical protein